MPEVMRHIGAGTPMSAGDAEKLARTQLDHWRKHGFGWRAVVELESGETVGLVGLNFAGEGTAGLDPGEYELGWWFDPAVWRRGYATEAAAAIRDEALNNLGAPSVVARIQPGNDASIRVAEAIGLKHDFDTTGRLNEPLGVWRKTKN